MELLEFEKKLEEYGLIQPVWKHVIKLLKKEFKVDDEILKLFFIYFALVDDGNITMSLKKDELLNKVNEKLNSQKLILEEKEDFNKSEYDELIEECKKIIVSKLDFINESKMPELIGPKKLFVIDNGYLYTSKFIENRNDIVEDIKRIFNLEEAHKSVSPFNYKDIVKDIELTEKQEDAVNKGRNKSLIITGGPGTGKTTSILFLLIASLEDDINKNIYLTAPTGKASQRMKESITDGFENLTDDFKEKNKEIIKKIDNLTANTIHTLLGFKNDRFLYNKEHQFETNSIFVIDEASMIDINMFASLLNAIPSGAKVYLLGDKNQLPSVNAGSVFGSLVDDKYLRSNQFIVELDVSKRFGKGTEIYELAECINNNGVLNVKENDFKDVKTFEVKPKEKGKYPVYFYLNNGDVFAKEKQDIDFIVSKWATHFFKNSEKDLSFLAKEVDLGNADLLNKINKIANEAKILCTTNEGIKGVNYINYIIQEKLNEKEYADRRYPGEIMMITKNNKLLDLSNGETGVIIKLKENNELYFMCKKEDTNDKVVNKNNLIKSANGFKFYPLSSISQSDITVAYAITIHKSQGEGYDNVLLILPTKKGHPLLVRQLIYTGITRTKGNTYILGNLDRLKEAKEHIIQRDTNISIK